MVDHVREGDAQARHAQVEVDGHGDRHELAEELEQRGDIDEVVEQPDEGHHRAADDDALGGIVEDRHEHHRGDQDAEVDGQPAEQRRRVQMHAPLVGGRVHGSGPLGDPRHQRGQYVDQAGREQEAEDRGLHRWRQIEHVVYGVLS